MRVGNGYGGEAAEPLHFLSGSFIDETDAVPQNVTAGALQQQGTLSDSKLRLGADTGQSRLLLPQDVVMVSL